MATCLIGVLDFSVNHMENKIILFMVVIKIWKTRDADAAWQRLERSKMKCLRPRLPAVDILGVLNPVDPHADPYHHIQRI